MLAKRVIPCLDVHEGKVTRGVQFGRAEAGELRNVGDPVELAIRYNEQGADEMVFFDITASAQGRASMIGVIERAADQCFMPLTVGGGIRSVADMHAMLKAGADKTSINIDATVAQVKQQVGKGRAICALSGGVDSSVAAVLVDRALRDYFLQPCPRGVEGSRLTCVFVNNGVLRKNEFEKVQQNLRDNLGLHLVAVVYRRTSCGSWRG